ncbi:MAG: BrnA antitoxin family protein [Rhodoferax sp.]|uniref:BrnA antitoxin family protein n=1 Tax=Rhodoferax sp. TaxID=50421 RepID=UPI002730D389|nr:BrnA antitoxin family protein [Rhodoferax sp.]MDP1531873.1 BrnA antitoxin family protein [Rhodoferax sp.]MDP1942790.1 BrnA antitoxin family protein [Rhodoferax sp.]MDP2442603.1 BrnA antitoxin family protein [Rhodoferax sp.]
MSKKPNPELIDSDNPEWTAEMFAQAKRISDLPTSLQAKLRGRGPQKAPPKVSTTIRLSPDVVQAFRAAGDGWQTRIDLALKDWLRTHSQV